MTAVVGGGVDARLRPAVLVQVSLLASLTCNLGRIPLFSVGLASAPLMVNDLAVGLLLITAVLVAARTRSLRVDAPGLAALLFAAIGGVSTLAAVPRFGLAPFEVVVSLAYLARWLFYFGIYLVVINWVQRRDVAAVWGALEWMMLAFCAFGVVQSLFLPGFAQMIYPESRPYLDWDPQGHRLVSTALEPNIAAMMIVLVLLVQLGQLAAGARVAWWKPALLFVAVVMTLSRSGALALLFGGVTILAVRGLNRRLVQLGALLLVAIVAALPKLIPFAQDYNKLSLTGSAVGRLVNLAQALGAFLDNPVIGVGFNTFGFYMERQGVARLGLSFQSSDGGLLFAAVMTGVLGLSVFVTMLVLVFRRCRRVWRNVATYSAMERGTCIGIAAGIVAIVVHSTFVNSLFATPVLQPLWVLWGLAYVIEARREPAASPVAPAEPRVLALAHG